MVSVAILFLGLCFAYYEMKFTWKRLILFVPPGISMLMLYTNHLHHLFFTTFSMVPSQQDFGIFFVYHSVVSYLYIGVGLTYLVVFSIKNYGFYSRQSLLISFGILVSLVFDSFSTLGIYDWPAYIENIAFAFTIACFILAMVRYDFLNIAPIANKIILDSLIDRYVIINNNFELVDYLVDYNKAFSDMFSNVQVLKRKDDVLKLHWNHQFGFNDTIILNSIKSSLQLKEKKDFELASDINGDTVHHKIIMIPINNGNVNIGVIVLIKDITESKNHLEQITVLNQQLQDLAIKDGLTKAYNRYFFEERLQQEIDLVIKQTNYGNPSEQAYGFGLIMFDIDFFKIYNDINGHQAGDELLQILVRVTQSALFATDILCRYGGEEFAVICCQTSMEGIGIAAEKIRKVVENHRFKYEDSQPNEKVTVSVGAAYYSTAAMNKEDLIKNADENLYISKNKGRNKTTFK